MAYSIKIERSDGNSGSNMWYKGSGGLKDNYPSGGVPLCKDDETSGWTTVYDDRKMFDSQPSESEKTAFANQLPTDDRSINFNNDTSLVCTVVSE